MAFPVEFRFFYNRYRIANLKQNMPNVRGPDNELYLPPTLQFRCRMKVSIGDSIGFEWSEWQEIPHVYETVSPEVLASAKAD
jgi:hypothetical protein